MPGVGSGRGGENYSNVDALRIEPHIKRLTQDEWYEVQKNPILGLHLLEKVSELPEAISYVAYQVHERENSTGYPKKRNSVLIRRFAKMAQVADIFEAITYPRSYRPARIPHEGVIQNLLDNDRIYQIDLVQETCIQITKPRPSNYLKNLDIMDGF
jgi:HD-GYP domain-containing protein (c-di-GMP phosphodiesterase class II)